MSDDQGVTAERWLRDRADDVPEPILDAMLGLVAATGEEGDAVADRLAEAGLAGLQKVVAGPGSRSSANQLLSADALLTYAIEAAAEQGMEPLDALLDSLSVERFDALTAQPEGEE